MRQIKKLFAILLTLSMLLLASGDNRHKKSSENNQSESI